MKPQALLEPTIGDDVYHPPSLRHVAVSDEVEAKVSCIELAPVNEATCGLEERLRGSIIVECPGIGDGELA